MSPIQLIGESHRHEIPDSYLLVGIDETGHEQFADLKYPIFGLGGCAVRTSEYERTLKWPWTQMRASLFPEFTGPLHAAEVGSVTGERAAPLGDFFCTAEFARLAAVVSNRTLLESDLPPYKLVARQVLEQIARLVGRRNCDGVAMIVEESSRTDRLAAAFFDRYDIELQRGLERWKLPFLKFRMPKSAEEPLLEIADFVMHVAGSQVRDALSGRDWGKRRDFRAIFLTEPDPRVEFLEIFEAKYRPSTA